MLENLKKKWGVSGIRFVLILFTFAIGGSITGYLGGIIMPALSISQKWLWVPVYLIMVTLIWPLAVLVVSIPLGQFVFFKNYLQKMFSRFGLRKTPHKPNE